MNDHLVRSIVGQMDRRALFLAPSYIPQLAADMRCIGEAKPAEERAAYEARKPESVSHYALAPVEQMKPFAFSGGLAIIPISGVLLNRFNYSMGFATGYNFIRAQVNAAAVDPDVQAIVLDINSPGGMCSGCRELSDDIFAAREQKPIMAMIDHQGLSAAMMLASAATHVVATPTSDVGSIGVVAMHADMSGLLSEIGIKITLIHAGAHKVDGNPFEALPDDVRKDIQRDLDAHYGMFVDAVARNRGMKVKAVRDTEARVYRAQDALGIGLIDAVDTAPKAIFNFMAGIHAGSSNAKGQQMSETKQPVVPVSGVTTAPPVALTLPTATLNATEIRTTERARISAILGHAEAVGRQGLATHLAMKTDMDVETAAGILAQAPKATEPKATTEPSAFLKAMDSGKHPNVGAEGGGESDDSAKVPRSERALAALLGPRPQDRKPAAH